MASINLDVSFVDNVAVFGAGSNDTTLISNFRSGALSTVWDGSGLDVLVLGGSLIADAILEEVHWSVVGWDGPFSEWNWS